MPSPDSIYSVHLSTAKGWRGGENQVWLLARGLLERGQTVLVVAPRGAALIQRCRQAQIPCEEIGVRGELDPLATLRLMRLLRRERPDILHLHDGHAVLHGQLAGRVLPRAGLKVVAHRRTIFPLKGRWKYGGRISRVIAISEAVRDKLLLAGIPSSRIRVIYSGLEFPERLPAEHTQVSGLRAQLGISGDDVLIAHAAALTTEKRQWDIIEATLRAREILKAEKGPNVHLALAGSGSQEDTLRAEVQQRSLQSWVHFLGFVQDLRPLWSAAALAVYASEAEGLCTALVEAQAAGLPAVVTQAGGMREVVVDRRSGFTVEIGDTAAMAEALAELVRQPALRTQMGAAAAQRAREKFQAQGMVEGVLGVYRELLSEAQ